MGVCRPSDENDQYLALVSSIYFNGYLRVSEMAWIFINAGGSIELIHRHIGSSDYAVYCPKPGSIPFCCKCSLSVPEEIRTQAKLLSSHYSDWYP